MDRQARQTKTKGRKTTRRGRRTARGKAGQKQGESLQWTLDSVAGEETAREGPSRLLTWMMVRGETAAERSVERLELLVRVASGDDEILCRSAVDLLANKVTAAMRAELAGVVERGIEVRIAQGETSVPVRFPRPLGVTSPSLLIALLAASEVEQALPVARLQELCDFDVPDERRPIGKARKLLRKGLEDRNCTLDNLDKLWPLPSNRRFDWGESAVLARIDSPTARQLAIPARIQVRRD